MKLSGLTVLSGILNDPLIAAFAAADGKKSKVQFLRRLYERGAETSFAAYVANAVLADENAFSRVCAAGKRPSSYVRGAYLNDLALIRETLDEAEEEGFCKGKLPAPFGSTDEATVRRLSALYRKEGYGRYLLHDAFRFCEGELVPVLSPSETTLSDLKGYEREKAEVRDNFENFVRGLPYADMLLYGDRGTGKSSTVHAMVNLFRGQKLRLVEIAKENVLALPELKTRLAAEPMKFVVFIDDFSLQESDDRVSTLKAALQGSMEGHVGNVMIVATSNRRHIVEENFSSRMNSVHMGDSEEELLSLSDRFGMTVLFAATNKQEYLAIVRAVAADMGLKTPAEVLESLAERWALVRGGRSPRRARQFVDYAYACEQKGREIDV